MDIDLKFRNRLYKSYSSWKEWGPNQRLELFSEQFWQELKRGEVKKNSKILEIGFGNGVFLEWAKQNGYLAFGVEITTDLFEKAKSRGFDVHLGSLVNIYTDLPTPFDAVVAFDVFEHLSKLEILETLEVIHKILCPGGCLIVSFPNGASPFGRIYQHGDLTHITTLSPKMIEQLANMTGFEIVRVCNSARSYFGGSRKRMLVLKSIAYFLRNLFEILIGYIYFGRRVPLDPSLTAILRCNRKSNVLQRDELMN